MSSANPPAKRRRHDTASSTLSKPFKSPLRQRPPPSTEQPSPPSSTTTNPNTKDEPKPNPQETSNQPNTSPPPHPQNPSAAAPTPPPSTTSKPRPNPKAKSRDPTHHAAQTQHRALQTRLVALRSDLDTAAQAQRIESSAKASELQALIAKWKAVAQDAAEEVFVGASERVGRMGGMVGYKERVRESKAAAARWDEEEEEDRSVEDEGEREDVKEEEEREKENEGEKEEFTMEFMLKTLNIDPKTIGYDCAGQRWVK